MELEPKKKIWNQPFITALSINNTRAGENLGVAEGSYGTTGSVAS